MHASISFWPLGICGKVRFIRMLLAFLGALFFLQPDSHAKEQPPEPLKPEEVAAIKPKGPGCAMSRLLDGKLFRVKNGKNEAYTIDHNKVGIYAIYFSASWCPPCRKFTPELLKFYLKNKAKHENFEVILIHHTERNAGAMIRYLNSAMKETNSTETFPAMGFNDTPPDKKGIKVHSTSQIPGLVLLNGDEKVLEEGYEGFNQAVPNKVFKKLHDLIGVPVEVKEAPAATPPPAATAK